MYYTGQGMVLDKDEAVKLYHKACDGGYMDACGALGMMYHKGLGVTKDEIIAVKLFRKACDGGFELACKHVK
jgi:hypothetical protein